VKINWIKRILSTSLCVVLSELLLVGCVATPQKDNVINHSEGFPKDKIESKSEKIKRFEISDKWVETIEAENKQVIIDADTSIKIPKIKNTPVYEIEKDSFENQDLKRLVTYFSDGKQIYQNPKMTKNEIEEIREMIQDNKGIYGRTGKYEYTADYLSNIKRLIKTAPESVKLNKIKNIEFSKYKATDYSIINYGMPSEDVVNQEDYFLGFIKNENKTAKITAVKGTIKNDKSGAFEYTVGTVYNESNLENDLTFKDTSVRRSMDSYIEEFNKYIDNATNTYSQSPSVSEEYAKNVANAILKDLGIEDHLELKTIEKAICYNKVREWNPYNNDESPDSLGYTLTYSYPYERVPMYMYPEVRNKYKDLGEMVYAPSFEPEILRITISKDGVRMFQWKNMSKKKDTITENSKLLPFSEIKTHLMEHLMAVKVSTDNVNGFKSEDGQNQVYIKNINFGISFMNALEHPKNVWLVPVWIFKVETISHRKGYDDVNIGTEYVVLNAYDGGYVAPL